jgi:hypothetical protein
MKRFTLAMVAGCLVAILASVTVAQKPVPGPVPNPSPVAPVVDDDGVYFAGATADDRAFIDAVLKGAAASDMGPFKQWRLQRLLKKPRFVEQAKAACAEDIYWDNPEVYNGLIDWENLDIEKLKELVEVIMKLIDFISKLFATLEPEQQLYGLNEVQITALIADKYNAVAEVRLWDGTRVDLLSDEFVIEVDWAPKWGEHRAVAVLRRGNTPSACHYFVSA